MQGWLNTRQRMSSCNIACGVEWCRFSGVRAEGEKECSTVQYSEVSAVGLSGFKKMCRKGFLKNNFHAAILEK